jgi:hypothetical protein
MPTLEPVQIGSTTEFNSMMVDLAERLNEIIRVKLLTRPRIWSSLIEKDVYPDGQGYSQKTITFHPGVGDLAGLDTWEEIQPSRAPGTLSPDDPGYDSCSYRAKSFDYGFSERELKGYRTARKSPTVCYNDVRYKWQFQDVLGKIFGFMTDITADVWDNFCREGMSLFSKKIVLTDTPDETQFTYNPLTSTDLKISAAAFNRISRLTFNHLDYWRQLMSLQCPEGASGADAGLPVFEFVVDPVDIMTIIEDNTKFWEAYLYADPSFLLEGYGKVKAFRGFAFLNDYMSARYTVKGTDGSDVVLSRVLPYVEETTTIGKKRVANPEYIKAEYGVVVLRPKNVFKLRIPSTKPENPAAGLKFGVQPTWGGDFFAINIQNETNNLLNEKCYFFARYASFLEPLENADDAVTLLYKRCNKVERVTCSTPDSNNTSADAISGTGEAIEPGSDGKYSKIRITLDKVLSQAAPYNITVTFADSSTANAILSGDSNAPTYEITFASADLWLTKGGGISTVTIA